MQKGKHGGPPHHPYIMEIQGAQLGPSDDIFGLILCAAMIKLLGK